jgi:uncharacterized protein YqgV (UPF0045/DUF77 family)
MQTSKVYMCKKHAGLHMINKGDHSIISLIFKPLTEEPKNISENISKVLKMLSEVRFKVITRPNRLSVDLRKQNIALTMIEEHEKSVKKIFTSFLKNKSIDKQYNEVFCSMKI